MKKIIFISLIGLCFNVNAEKINIKNIGNIDYSHISTEISNDNEHIDDFVNRISNKLRIYSYNTGFEACGVIATNGVNFGVIIGSNNSHISCVNLDSIVPNGMLPTKDTLHSHGRDQPFRPNKNDLLLNPNLERIGFGRSSGRINLISGQKLDEFSEQDFEQGDGYLVTPTEVIHQEGKNKIRKLKQ